MIRKLILTALIIAPSLSHADTTIDADWTQMTRAMNMTSEKIDYLLIPNHEFIPTEQEKEYLALTYENFLNLKNVEELKITLAHYRAHLELKHGPAQKTDVVTQRKWHEGEIIVGALAAATYYHHNINRNYSDPGADIFRKKGTVTEGQIAVTQAIKDQKLNSPYNSKSPHSPEYKDKNNIENNRALKIRKAEMINLAREEEADKLTIKYASNAGVCQDAYYNFLQDAYENPEGVRKHSHFKLSTKDWKRLENFQTIQLRKVTCRDDEAANKKDEENFLALKSKITKYMKEIKPNSPTPPVAEPALP